MFTATDKVRDKFDRAVGASLKIQALHAYYWKACSGKHKLFTLQCTACSYSLLVKWSRTMPAIHAALTHRLLPVLLKAVPGTDQVHESTLLIPTTLQY